MLIRLIPQYDFELTALWKIKENTVQGTKGTQSMELTLPVSLLLWHKIMIVHYFIWSLGPDPYSAF